jgi:uncharacterized membrane protein
MNADPAYLPASGFVVFEKGASRSVAARRNNSLSSNTRSLICAFTIGLLLAIGLAFAALGAWPVLLFVAGEAFVLFLALRDAQLHADDYERLTLTGDRVEIEIADADKVKRYEFNRWWAQIICALDGRRLAVRSHGREVEFGSGLTDDQRLALARVLRETLKPN